MSIADTHEIEVFLGTALALDFAAELEFAATAGYNSSPLSLHFVSALSAKLATTSLLFFADITCPPL